MARVAARLAMRQSHSRTLQSSQAVSKSDQAAYRTERRIDDLDVFQNPRSEKIRPAIAAIDSSSRLARATNAGASATNAVSAIRHSAEQVNAVRVPESLRDTATILFLNWPRENLEAQTTSLANSKLRVASRFAPPIRRVISIANFSQREPVEPRVEPRPSSGDDFRPTIAINSSPTVVIQAQTGSDLRNDVVEALRTHREELFDQLKRESLRRERAQF
jgi:hypothetical protein